WHAHLARELTGGTPVPPQKEIEAGSRSPLHNPASTHGRLMTTELIIAFQEPVTNDFAAITRREIAMIVPRLVGACDHSAIFVILRKQCPREFRLRSAKSRSCQTVYHMVAWR